MLKKISCFMRFAILLCIVGTISAECSSAFEYAITSDSMKDFISAVHGNPNLYSSPEYRTQLLHLSEKRVAELVEQLGFNNQNIQLSMRKDAGGNLIVLPALDGKENEKNVGSEKQVNRLLIKKGLYQLVGSVICGGILGYVGYKYYMNSNRHSGFMFVLPLLVGWVSKCGIENIYTGLDYQEYIKRCLNNQYEIQRSIKIKNNDIVQDASYYIIAGNEQSIFGGIGSNSTHVTFYNADGDELVKLSRKECSPFNAENKLDPSASKPKVATYAIKWWPAISVGKGKRKGSPGYFVVLKDKHGNYIDSFRYNEKTKEISVVATGIYIYPSPPAGFSSYVDEFTDRMTHKAYKVNSVYDLKHFDMSNCVEQGSDPIVDHSARQRKKYKK